MTSLPGAAVLEIPSRTSGGVLARSEEAVSSCSKTVGLVIRGMSGAERALRTTLYEQRSHQRANRA